jgi:mannose-6-phosphate isomerase-like protein (cupin superfamily)
VQPSRTDKEAVKQAWAGRGFSCEVWIDPPHQVWRDFEHDVDELRLLLEGEGQVEMSGRTVRVHAGDELLIPAGTRHTIRNCGDGAARWLRGFRIESAEAG